MAAQTTEAKVLNTQVLEKDETEFGLYNSDFDNYSLNSNWGRFDKGKRGLGVTETLNPVSTQIDACQFI